MITKYVDGKTQEFRLILQGDFGKDPDDVFALLNSYDSVDCVIANLSESILRARLAKSVLRDLGNTTTVVYAASNPGKGIIKTSDYEFDYPNLVNEEEIVVDNNPYHTILKDSTPSVIVINSAMTDLANFFTDSYDPTIHKIHLIVMQGGYEQDSTGYITPNCAANNSYDFYSAQICFDYIQQKNLPFVIITKQIAYDNPIPASAYQQLDYLYQYSPVTTYLNKISTKAIQDLYTLAIMDPKDPNRQGLPIDRDTQWFFDNIAKTSIPSPLPKLEDIGSYITTMNVYDVFTVLYAIEYQPHHKFDHIRLKNKFCEATAKANVNYIQWIYQNSTRNVE